MPNTVILKPAAEKQFRALPGKDQKRVAQVLDQLESTSTPDGCKKLSNNDDVWRVRKGPYRVLYTSPNDDGEIEVLKIAHRRDAYKGFN